MSSRVEKLLGIHHVTAITSDPQRNVDFYTGMLGLRLVKLTVNFDDPSTYHLYYGDHLGHPGTILTFFAWPCAPKGLLGTGQLTVISFSIPETAIEFWIERFKRYGIAFKEPSLRFDEQVLPFEDPDGIQLEIVAHPDVRESRVWKDGPIPPEYALRGFFGVTLSEESYERTASLLGASLEFRQIREKGNRFRFEVGTGGPSAIVDVIRQPDATRGVVSAGTVHHVAWRTPDDEQQKVWRKNLAGVGLNVTPMIDRKYFHSIYFREPGGVLFEIATDPPGFLVDEPEQELGTRLMLPSWLESHRQEIERALAPVRLPAVARAR